MKLEEGKSYGMGFWIFGGLWILLSIFPYPESIKQPSSFAFGCLVVCMVLVQLKSGVCLDRSWNASIVFGKSKYTFVSFILGQLAIAAWAILGAIDLG